MQRRGGSTEAARKALLRLLRQGEQCAAERRSLRAYVHEAGAEAGWSHGLAPTAGGDELEAEEQFERRVLVHENNLKQVTT